MGGIIHHMYPSDWLFFNNAYPKTLFTRRVKNFVRRAFFSFSDAYRNFLLCANNFLRSKFCLIKEKMLCSTKFFYAITRLSVLKTTFKSLEVDFYSTKGKNFFEIVN